MINLTKLVRLCESQNWRCAYCGIAVLIFENRSSCQGNAATVDHVRPVGQGGPRDWKNEVAACWHCNNTRGDIDAHVYFCLVQRHGRVAVRQHARRIKRRMEEARRCTAIAWPAPSKPAPSVVMEALDASGKCVARFHRKSRQWNEEAFYAVLEAGKRRKKMKKPPAEGRPLSGASLGSVWPVAAAAAESP